MSPRSFENDTRDQIGVVVRKAFAQVFELPIDVVAAAPGRVNLMGEHVDYNDGVVLPLAINRYTTIAARRNSQSNKICLYSTQTEELAEIDLSHLQPSPNRWTNYVVGVVAGFLQKGCQVPAFEAAIHSTIPPGAGLSSSAALEVATATMIESLVGQTLEPADKALLCQTAEHDYANVPCGIMDQFASVFGKANHLIKIDCRIKQVELIPFETDEISVLVFNSHAKHALVDSEYVARIAQSNSALNKLGCGSYRDASFQLLQEKKGILTDVELRRARHVIAEIDRTCRVADLIQSGDWDEAGKLLYASHDSLRDDYEVSSVELDLLVELARGIGPGGGMIGMRMTGGGFGGCTVSLVRTDEIENITERIQTEFEASFCIRPDAFSTLPAAGAFLVGHDQ